MGGPGCGKTVFILAARCNGYIAKPMSYRELLGAVTLHLTPHG